MVKAKGDPIVLKESQWTDEMNAWYEDAFQGLKYRKKFKNEVLTPW